MYHKQGGSWHRAASQRRRAQGQTTLLEAEPSPSAMTPALIMGIMGIRGITQRRCILIEAGRTACLLACGSTMHPPWLLASPLGMHPLGMHRLSARQLEPVSPTFCQNPTCTWTWTYLSVDLPLTYLRDTLMHLIKTTPCAPRCPCTLGCIMHSSVHGVGCRL
jgi:hypothetical protein